MLSFWESDGALGFGAQPPLPLLDPGSSEFFLPNVLGLTILFCHPCTTALLTQASVSLDHRLLFATSSAGSGQQARFLGYLPPPALFLALIYVYSDHIYVSPVSAVGHGLS